MFKRIGVLLLARDHLRPFVWNSANNSRIPGLPSFVSTAQAVVGRPLTPVSYAGVARRTARRCAAGVYC